MELFRDDGTIKCPICYQGTMCEHDIGYDECDSCEFFVIYPSESDGMFVEELLEIYKVTADLWKLTDE